MVKVSRARAAELRRDIFEATEAELSAVGYDAMALTAVASRCDLATSAIYNRFRSKPGLAIALVAERLEPVLGGALDARDAARWDPDLPAAEPPAELRSAMFELLLAARHNPPLRPSVEGFLRGRLDAALVHRGQAEEAGRLRAGQEPLAQVLLGPATMLGGYVLSLASEPPSSGSATVDHLLSLTLLDRPRDEPAPRARAARRRRDPGLASVPGHALDEIGEALVLASADAFADLGYEQATVAEIVQRAGLTTGAIYNRFAGKGSLLAEVIGQIVGPRVLAPVAETALAATSASPAEGGRVLGAALEALRAGANSRETSLRIESRHAARREPEVDAAIRPLQDHLLATTAAAIREAQTEGLVRPDVDPEALAWFVLSAPVGLSLFHTSIELPPVDWAPTVTAFLKTLRTLPAA